MIAIVTRLLTIGMITYPVGAIITDPTIVALILQESYYQQYATVTEGDGSLPPYIPVPADPLAAEVARAMRAEAGLKSALSAEIARAQLAEAAAVQSVNGKSGSSISLTAADVGAPTTDALSAEVTRAQAAEAGKAPLDASSYVPLANLRIRRAQFLIALEAQASGNGQTLFNAVPANPGSTIWIAYNHEPFVETGGALAAFVQSTFGFSAAQMTALFTAAAQVGN